MTGSSNIKPFSKWFQIRWAERLGDPNNPYLIRWTFILFGYSIRIHHWLRSDDRRFFHDHSADLLSIVIKGYYFNVIPVDPSKPPTYKICTKSEWNSISKWKTFISADKKFYLQYLDKGYNTKFNFVEGMFNSWINFKECWKRSIWFSKATQQHYLDIPKEGAWTLLFEGKKYHKWGFYVPRKGSLTTKKMRPLRYFSRYGIIQNQKGYQ